MIKDDRRAILIRREGGKAGLRGKINAMCISCLYDEGSGGGTWKQQVEACTSPACPLYPVRAKSEKAA